MTSRHVSLFWLLLFSASLALHAQPALRVVPGAKTQSVFAGGTRPVSIIWENPADLPVTENIHLRIYRAETATAVMIGEFPWKELQLLPHQTILESAAVTFPAVSVATDFVIQWINSKNRIFGVTHVTAYPAQLLKELPPGDGDGTLGVSDPSDRIKAALRMEEVAFVDLDVVPLGDFTGRLAIIAAGDADVSAVRNLAKKGVAVVWIHAAPCSREEPLPSYYLVTNKKAAVVVVQPELVADPLGQPLAQLRMAYFARLALNPEPFGLTSP